MSPPRGILELFAGIGGVARAHPGVVAAIDQDEAASSVYAANFDHPVHRRNLASVKVAWLSTIPADTWWMSPPCQPFTVRGRARDVDDPRCAALLHLIDLLEPCRPRALALENVPGFAGSRAHARLTAQLRRLGYHVAEGFVCPTELGVPNERRRFYLVARLDRAPDWRFDPVTPTSLADHLDSAVDAALYVSEDRLRRYGSNLPVVRADDPDAVPHCFTSAYGRSPVYAGSYLHDAGGVRHFSPNEILSLLGFAPALTWPHEVTLAKRYKLAGNSLSVVVARQILRAALET